MMCLHLLFCGRLTNILSTTSADPKQRRSQAYNLTKFYTLLSAIALQPLQDEAGLNQFRCLCMQAEAGAG